MVLARRSTLVEINLEVLHSNIFALAYTLAEHKFVISLLFKISIGSIWAERNAVEINDVLGTSLWKVES